MGTICQRFERYLERIAAKVPEDRRIEAHPQIAGSVFAGLEYVEETGINAELFLNLLARAIDRERVSEAHSAFAQIIICQLSPDEAMILFRLKKRPYVFRQHAVYLQDTNLHSLNLAGIW